MQDKISMSLGFNGVVELDIIVFNGENMETFRNKMKQGIYILASDCKGIRKSTGNFETVGTIKYTTLRGEFVYESDD